MNFVLGFASDAIIDRSHMEASNVPELTYLQNRLASESTCNKTFSVAS